MKIAPSLLSCDFSKVKDELHEIEKLTDIVHLDVMDGHFVPNLTFGSSVIASWRKESKIIFDTHLMIENVEKYLEDYVNAGSDYVTFHYEATNDMLNLINKIKLYQKKAGISIKPNTDVRVLEPYLKDIDLILIMSVEPGFGGQSFIENSLEKINWLYNERKNNGYNYLISVDGGINRDTVKKVKDKVDICVCGSYFFKGNKKERMKELCE